MKSLLIDSCVLYQEMAAASDEFYELATLSSTRGMRLIVPEVLIREHCSVLFRKVFDSSQKASEKHRRRLMDYLCIDVNQSEAALKRSLMDVYPSALKARLRHMFKYVETVAYPEVDAQVLLDRAVFREKPFHRNDSGRVGDWLLLLSAASIMKSGDSLEFITNNLDDFVDKDDGSRGQNGFDLSSSLTSVQGAKGDFKGVVYPSIGDFLRVYGVTDDVNVGVFEKRHPKVLLLTSLFHRVMDLITWQLQAYEYPEHCVTQDIGGIEFDVTKVVRVDTRPSIDIFAVKYAVRLPVYLSSDRNRSEYKMADLTKRVARLSVWTKMTVSQSGDVHLERIVGSRLKGVVGYERAFTDSAHISMMLGEFPSDDEPYMDKAGG